MAYLTSPTGEIQMDIATVIAIIISATAVLSSVIGPMITAAITCRHERKMYQKRLLLEHEHEVIERYLRTIGRYAFGNAREDQKDLGDAISEIFMYAPIELHADLQNINNLIIELMSSNYDHAWQLRTKLRKSYLELCEKFAPYCRSEKTSKKRRSQSKKK